MFISNIGKTTETTCSKDGSPTLIKLDREPGADAQDHRVVHLRDGKHSGVFGVRGIRRAADHTGKQCRDTVAQERPVQPRLVKEVLPDDVAVSDLVYYEPSDGPAMFMAKAMYGSQGELVGVLALQIPTERIVEIMNFRGGMGATGETYLVGEDLLMRSNSR